MILVGLSLVCVQTSSGAGGNGAGIFGNPTGGGNQGNTIGNEIPVIPMTQNPLEQIIECINAIDLLNPEEPLTSDMITWLSNNRQASFEINEFLKT